MPSAVTKRTIVSHILSLCLLSPSFSAIAADITGSPPSTPEGQDLVYYDDFSGAAVGSSWDLYGSGATLSQKDGALVCALDIEPGENGQTGPRYNVPSDISGSWLGRTVTISWKMYSDVKRGVRLNLAPGPNVEENGEVNIFGDWGVLDNCPAGEWVSCSAQRLVEGDMAGGDFSLFFKINGAGGTVRFDDIMLTVSAAKPQIQTGTLSPAVSTVPYEQRLAASGSQPFSWSLSGGVLPAGLELSKDGILSGTPTEVIENARFTVEATNSLGADSKELTLTILEADSMFTLANTEGKHLGDSNPLYTQHFGADPWAMEYDGRLYVYMTNDVFEYDAEGKLQENGYSKIRHINVISSADLVNWTDHGSIPVAGPSGVAKWANNSWAPCAAWRNENGKDKFYLYFTNGGGGIGVLTADSPVGPWTDPNGKPLVSHATENCASTLVPWCFDPAVFIDDDGRAYLYFGGGIRGIDYADPKSGRVVQLKDNLTEIDGIPKQIAPPYFFEASAMHKYNGKYYYTYSSNFNSPGAKEGAYPGSGNIAYMQSDSPMGPFSYVGEVLANPGNFGFGGGNNHQCVFSFKGEWYIAYHGSLVSMDKVNRSGYRSTQIDKLSYNADGTMSKVTGTRAGVPQLSPIDPYTRIEAETIAWQGGINTVMADTTQQSSTNLFVTGIEQGDWLSVSLADLGSTAPLSFAVNAAGKRGGQIELRVGSPDPDDAKSVLAGTLSVPEGDGTVWETYTAPLTAEITETQHLFLTFRGDVNGAELFDLDWWQLSHTPVESAEPIPPEPETEPSSEPTEPGALVTDEPDVTEEGDEPSESPVPTEQKPKDNTWFWAGAAILGAGFLCVSSLFFLKKKKKK